MWYRWFVAAVYIAGASAFLCSGAAASAGNPTESTDSRPESGAQTPDCRKDVLGHAPDRGQIEERARCEAEKQAVPAELVLAVIEIESNFVTNARGADGEVGLMQVMPPTAKMLGFSGSLNDLAEAGTNIRLGTKYLADAYRLAKADLCTTVMKYRAGHGETCYSYLSVAYCRRARQIFRSKGVPIQGELPKPNCGKPIGAGRAVASGKRRGSCVARQMRAGPGYGSCLRYARGKSATSIAKARRGIFR